jgi:hypothetical protein
MLPEHERSATALGLCRMRAAPRVDAIAKSVFGVFIAKRSAVWSA